jgi:hypothetical protein
MNTETGKADDGRSSQASGYAFRVGDEVEYHNHVAGYTHGKARVVRVNADNVSILFWGKELAFNLDGSATWSSNLAIRHNHKDGKQMSDNNKSDQKPTA